MTEVWRFAWDHGHGEVQSLGGMVGPVWFDLDGGASVQPFFVAPWADEPDGETLPGLLRRLRGEWPCVPFGVERKSPAANWEGKARAIGDGAPHGHGANNPWHLIDRGKDWIEIGIDYPAGHPVRHLRRRIAGQTGAATICITLQVVAAEQIDLGLALHPTFRLPEAPRATGIEVGGLRRGLTFPGQIDASSCAAPGQWFDRLDLVPGSAGGSVDFSWLPPVEQNEDLLQLQADAGWVRVSNEPERWCATVRYDPTLFPSVVLWLTNRGWTAPPWSGRTVALGIEPARAAFDLGQPVSADLGNPLSQAGIPTSIQLRAGEVLATHYSIGMEALA
jgi:hypothetical protein